MRSYYIRYEHRGKANETIVNAETNTRAVLKLTQSIRVRQQSVKLKIISISEIKGVV